jgi:hypothetical protein
MDRNGIIQSAIAGVLNRALCASAPLGVDAEPAPRADDELVSDKPAVQLRSDAIDRREVTGLPRSARMDTGAVGAPAFQDQKRAGRGRACKRGDLGSAGRTPSTLSLAALAR